MRHFQSIWMLATTSSTKSKKTEMESIERHPFINCKLLTSCQKINWETGPLKK